MFIDKTQCITCESCIAYCPVGAISIHEEYAEIDREMCVECGVCYRDAGCPGDAFVWEELKWPRIIRRVFSDPTLIKQDTKVTGRGTEEMKTNDVTGRFRAGYVGVGIELGRPSVGTSFRDVEKMTLSLTQNGIEFEKKNPLTKFIDIKTGELDKNILNERVLSAIIEICVPIALLDKALITITNMDKKIDTVFSLDLIYINDENTKASVMRTLNTLGITASLAGKTNVGLGRPLAKEVR